MSAPRERRGPRGRLGELARRDRPRERVLASGPGSLTDEELVAVLLGTGTPERPVLETARHLLRNGGLHGLLSRAGPATVKLDRGIGPAKTARLLSAVEIARRLLREDLRSRDLVDGPDAAARYLATALAGEVREVMGALLLDARNRLLEDHVVFRGTTTVTAVAPGPLFRAAVVAGASGLLLYHNHPSGDPSPSVEDHATTRRLVEAGRLLGVEVRDHLIVARGSWVSFRQRGWLTA